MKDPVEVVGLWEVPWLAARLATWHWRQWGHEFPSDSCGTWRSRLEMWARDPHIPCVLVATDGQGEPLGSASLVEHDLPDEPELACMGPWLSGVYVAPEHRSLGLGSRLVTSIERCAADRGFARLFLYTETTKCFYLRLGWDVACEHAVAGRTVAVMCKQVGRP